MSRAPQHPILAYAKNRHRHERWLVCLCALMVATVSLGTTGCHRSFYRRQADTEAVRLIHEKTTSDHWALPNYQMEADPASRMYQPFSKDHPPMPPDDPFSNQYMELVDNKPGYPLWHANGDTWYVENPEWRYYLNLNGDGELELDFDSAVETALLHSRSYRFQHEEIYLSALDVSLERFAFDSQLFAGYSGFLASDGPDRNGIGTGSSNTLDANTGTRGLRLEKLGTTGSTLIVGFANSLLWEYSGTNDFVGTTFIDFSLIQPLLRRAGRDRIMEQLTDAERTLLGNVRQLERFRRGFYLQVTTGRSAGSGVSRTGDFISGSAGGGVGAVGGLLGLLRDRQNIQIQEANVSSLRAFLDQFREYNRAGRINQLQVQQSESALYAAQDSLIQAKNDYETTLDAFKIVLGLPPDLPLKINDPLLDQFQLFDPETIAMQNQMTDMQREAGEIIIRIEDRRTEFLEPSDNQERITDTTVEGLFWTEDDRVDLLELKDFIAKTKTVNQEILNEVIARAKSDVENLIAQSTKRKENLTRLREQIEQATQDNSAPVEPEVLSFDRLESGPGELSDDIAELAGIFDSIDQELDKIDQSIDEFLERGPDLPPVELYRLLYNQILKEVPKQLTELSGRYLELSLVMVRARTDTIMRTPVEITPELAIAIAHRNRRDLMNARADLVDSWRQIEFVADDLESTFDLVFEGDIGNRSDNPLDLRTTTGRLRAGFQFDAPFTRQLERNSYREALIEYDRTRRQFYAYEDEVARSLREIIRNLEQSKISFELSRRSILIAVAQVELARYNLIEPPRTGSERSQLGATTARDLNDALSRLQSAQFSFLNTWVNYETLRRTLDFELGTMQLDDRGQWIDPGPLTPEMTELMLQQGPLSDEDLGPGIDWTGGVPNFIDESSPYSMEPIEPSSELPAEDAVGPATDPQPGELLPAGQDAQTQNDELTRAINASLSGRWQAAPESNQAPEARPQSAAEPRSKSLEQWRPLTSSSNSPKQLASPPRNNPSGRTLPMSQPGVPMTSPAVQASETAEATSSTVDSLPLNSPKLKSPRIDLRPKPEEAWRASPRRLPTPQQIPAAVLPAGESVGLPQPDQSMNSRIPASVSEKTSPIQVTNSTTDPKQEVGSKLNKVLQADYLEPVGSEPQKSAPTSPGSSTNPLRGN